MISTFQLSSTSDVSWHLRILDNEASNNLTGYRTKGKYAIDVKGNLFSMENFRLDSLLILILF